VLTPQRAVVATGQTDEAGKFFLTDLPDGEYVVAAQYPARAEQRAAVRLSSTAPVSIDLVLQLVTSAETVASRQLQPALSTLRAAPSQSM
jgi:hypothetical protein